MTEDRTGSEQQLMYGSALLIGIAGLFLASLLAFLLALATQWTVTQITALFGAFTTLIGTLVGAFLAVQANTLRQTQTKRIVSEVLTALHQEQAREAQATQKEHVALSPG